VTRQNAGQVTGRRIGKAGAREFTLVTAGAGIATLGLALMFGAAVQASPGADPVPPTPGGGRDGPLDNDYVRAELLDHDDVHADADGHD
jgi:hypothetical protein